MEEGDTSLNAPKLFILPGILVVIIPGLLVLLLLIGINIIGYGLELGFSRTVYNNEVEGTKSLINRRLQAVSVAVESTRAFFASGNEINKEEFDLFSSALVGSIAAGPIAMPITIEWVDANNNIRYAYPMNEDNAKVIGLDLNQYPNRLLSIEKAKTTRSTVVTEPIMLQQGYPGLILYSPIYRGGNYFGEALVVMRLSHLLAPVASSSLVYSKNEYIQTKNFIVPIGADVILNNSGERVINPQGDLVKDPAAQNYILPRTGEVSQDIVIADKVWQLKLTPSYIDSAYQRTELYAGISFVFESLFLFFLWFAYRRRGQIVSERNKIEKLANDLQKFKLAVDNASDQIVITDAEGIVIYGNRAIEKITGYKPEEAIGKKAGVLWRQPMGLEYYQNLWSVIKTQKKEYVGEITNIKKDGTVYTAIISISPIFDVRGALIYFVGIERDISKERALDKAKSEFISLASHQLGTPITAISWNVEALLDGDKGPISEEQKTVLKQIHESSKNMAELVGGFLDITKIEASGFPIEEGEVDLLQISDSVLNELASQITDKKIVLQKKYGDGIPYLAIGTKTARIILQNLLTNAIKYTPENGKVDITIEKTDNKVMIAVKDSGYGIPDEAKSRIFTKLFRADNIKEKVPMGTGLGLYLLKTLVERLGGRVWFESKEGVGTVFYVNLLIK